MAVAVEPPGSDRIASPAAARAIYFACSEGITNAIKHAAAQAVGITLRAVDDGWLLLIVDDGCGGADGSKGSGLQGLVDRVEALGGCVGVSSPVGAGTRLAVELPFGQPDDNAR